MNKNTKFSFTSSSGSSSSNRIFIEKSVIFICQSWMRTLASVWCLALFRLANLQLARRVCVSASSFQSAISVFSPSFQSSVSSPSPQSPVHSPQLPVLNPHSSVPSPQCAVPNLQSPVSSSQSPVLSAQFPVPVSGPQSSVLSRWSPVLSPQSSVLSPQSPVSSPRSPVPSLQSPVFSPQSPFPVSSPQLHIARAYYMCMVHVQLSCGIWFLPPRGAL